MENSNCQCNDVLDILKRKGINFIAIDFDLTLISRHTSSQYRGKAKDLVLCIRSCFSLLIPVLLDNLIAVSIVTFSNQTELIREVTKLAFPFHWSKIVVRTSDKSWGDAGDRDRYGKQKYIASAAEESELLFNIDIARNTTLLIDDQQENIRVALRDGVRAILFIPENPNSIFKDIVAMDRK
eukprot:gene27974-36844_t